MLKDLKYIGDYVAINQSLEESLVHIPAGSFYILSLVFDGKDFVFDLHLKEWDKNDILAMCFKPGKATASSLLPSAYISLSFDKEEPVFLGLEKIENTLKINKTKFPMLETLYNAFSEFASIEKIRPNKEIVSLLTGLPKKDENKRIVVTILALKLTKEYSDSLWFMSKSHTSHISKDSLYFWEIEELRQYFLSSSQGEGAVCVQGFCHICEQQKEDIINFPRSTGVNFDYKFYNLDKLGFAYDLNADKGMKSFWICQGCYREIKLGYNYFKIKLFKNILGTRAYIFPTFFFSPDKEYLQKVFWIFEKYGNISQLETNLNGLYHGQESRNDIFDLYFSLSTSSEKEVLLGDNLLKLNFLFWQIDGAKSDEFKIKYVIKDIIPWRLAELYRSEKRLNRMTGEEENILTQLARNFFTETAWLNNGFTYLSDFYLYPTYEKGKYVFNLKGFLEWDHGNEENYYQFLRKYLTGDFYTSKEFWSLAYKKLSQEYREKYLKSKEGNLKMSLWEIYLTHQYFLENKLLSIITTPMEKISFSIHNEKLQSLEQYFNSQPLFDSRDKVYIALVGLYVQLCVKLQKKEIGSAPLMTEINFSMMNYDYLVKLLNKSRDKFNKYSAKKFMYYPELYKTILLMRMDLDATIKRDEIVYYFSLGMEVLPDIFRNNSGEIEKSDEEIQ